MIKRMKDKAFARGVKREDLRAGAELLGLPLEEHIGNVIGVHARAGRRARPARARCSRQSDLVGLRSSATVYHDVNA